MQSCLEDVKWDNNGLVPVIAQDSKSGKNLMVAWMNREALAKSIESGEAVYWSRSRQKLWHKGEESGNTQVIEEMRLDCDADVIVLRVSQNGGVACHTGRESCFYRVYNNGRWDTVDPVIKDPKEMYSDKNESK